MTEQANAQPMAEARGLVKRYGNARAVNELSFQVQKGEVVGFLGPNGAGKSTTMKMLSGFLRPTEGQALVGGIDVADDPIAAQSKLGYLPESAPLYGDMMVIDFLRYVGELRSVPTELMGKRLKGICERCGLMDVLGKDIGQLSKGFRQRVGLAQAMLHDPDLLILDEPTSGLDPNQIIEIRELIKDLGQEKTVILSTHILPEVQATCDRILIISDGAMVADDTPENLTAQDAGSVISLVVKATNGTPLDRSKMQELLLDLPGVGNVILKDGEGGDTLGFSLRAQGSADPREAVFSAAVKNEFILLDMHRERVSLEETFRRLTRGGNEGGQDHA